MNFDTTSYSDSGCISYSSYYTTFSPFTVDATPWTDLSSQLSFASVGSYTFTDAVAGMLISVSSITTSNIEKNSAWCSSGYSISASSISDVTYAIGDGATMTVSVSQFSYTGCAMGWVTDYTATVPSSVTWSSTDMEFSIINSNQGDAFTSQTVTLIGTYSGVQAVRSFQVNFVSCSSTVITKSPSSIVDPEYDISSGVSLDIATFAFTQSYTTCPTIQYLLYDSMFMAADSIFTFSDSTQILSVSTSDPSKVTTYNLKMKGYSGMYAYEYLDFTVSVVHNCPTAKITTYGIEGDTDSYQIGDESKKLVFSQWTENLGYCGTFTYSALDDSSTALDSSLITFDSSKRTFTIYSDDDSKANQVITIIVTGSATKVATITSTYTFTLQILERDVTCEVSAFEVPSINGIDYQLGSSKVSIIFAEFSYTPSCDYTFTYQVFDTYPENVPGFLTFDSESRTISIETNDVNYIGTHAIFIKGTLNDDVLSYTQASFTLNIVRGNDNQETQNTLPFFMSEIPLIIIEQNKTLVYKLPDIKNPSDEETLITLSNLPSFITYEDKMLTLKPKVSTNSGTYQIVISLSNNDNYPNQQNYIFYVQVNKLVINAEENTDKSDDENNSSDNNGDNNYEDYDPFQKNLTKKQKQMILNQQFLTKPKVEKTKISQNLKAKISEISMTGDVTIKFSQEILVYENYSYFDDSILSLQIISSNTNLSVEDWSVNDLTSSSLTLSVAFNDGGLVATTEVMNCSLYQIQPYDILQIVFLANAYFIDSSDKLALSLNHSSKQYIPPQLSKDKETIQSIGATVKIGLVGAASLSFIMNIALTASLNQLWAVLDILQLIIYLPLFNLNIPTNFLYLANYLKQAADFKIIDTDPLWDKVLGFANDTIEEAVPSQQIYGYNTTNILRNIGAVFVFILAMLLALILLRIFKLLVKKVRFLLKIHDRVFNFLFLSAILRPCIEGYFVMCISTFKGIPSIAFDIPYNKINSSFTIAFLVFIVVLPIFSFVFLWKNKGLLENKQFRMKYETLYESLDTKKPNVIFLPAISLLRRFIFAFSVIYLSFNGCIQLFIQILFSLFQLQFFLSTFPFSELRMNFIQIMNELVLIVVFYFCFLFTDFVPDQTMQYRLGWEAFGVVSFALFINLILMLQSNIEMIIEIYHKWKKIRFWRNNKQVRAVERHIHSNLEAKGQNLQNSFDQNNSNTCITLDDRAVKNALFKMRKPVSIKDKITNKEHINMKEQAYMVFTQELSFQQPNDISIEDISPKKNEDNKNNSLDFGNKMFGLTFSPNLKNGSNDDAQVNDNDTKYKLDESEYEDVKYEEDINHIVNALKHEILTPDTSQIWTPRDPGDLASHREQSTARQMIKPINLNIH